MYGKRTRIKALCKYLKIMSARVCSSIDGWNYLAYAYNETMSSSNSDDVCSSNTR